MNERLMALEKQVAHQQYLLEQFEQVINDQAETMSRLDKKLRIIQGKLQKEDLIDAERTETDDRPPHY